MENANQDQELMRRTRERDEMAFDALLERYSGAIRRHLAGMVRDKDAAEDLVQEVFLRVWTRTEQWDGRGALRGWLYRIATNLALNHLRSVSRRRERPLELPPDPENDDLEPQVPGWLVDLSTLGPEAMLEASEQREQLQRLLSALPEEKREVVRLVHEAEMNLREVAEALGIPEGTVKSRLHYATKELAQGWKELENEWEE